MHASTRRPRAHTHAPAHTQAQYGLFSADFTDRSGQDYVVGYEEWAKAARDPNAFLRVHGAQVAGVIAAAASILTFVAYFRTVCSKVEVRGSPLAPSSLPQVLRTA
jgi:hypothetical protein